MLKTTTKKKRKKTAGGGVKPGVERIRCDRTNHKTTS